MFCLNIALFSVYSMFGVTLWPWYGARVPDLIQLYVKSHALGLLCFLWHLTLLLHVSDTTCSVVGSFAGPNMLFI